MADLDMVNRDPNNINDHVKVAFSDVLAEPDGQHSLDCIWKLSYFCFEFGKGCCYNLMTCFCGACIALNWGCEFAFITFEQVWCLTPALRVFSIMSGALQKCFGTCINCCFAPICETCGLCFSRITVENK